MKKLATSTASLAIILSSSIMNGCVSDNQERYVKIVNKRDNLIAQEEAYQKYKAQQSKHKISIKVENRWIYSVLKKVSKKYHITLDKKFIPSKDYTISANTKVGFNELLDLIYRQTGVEYQVEDGVLQIHNKEVVEQYERPISCTKGNSFTIALKNAPIDKVFSRLIKEGYNIEYDTKYYNIGNIYPNLSPFPKVNFYYKGCSNKEAYKRLAKTYNLDIKFKGNNVIVKDYQTLEVNIPEPFEMTYSSGSARIGESQASGGVQLQDAENPEKTITNLISSYMSPKGKAYLSKRGYVSITDTPQSIKRLKKILNKELKAQQNIELKITIISVELNDKYQSGVDWSTIINTAGKLKGIDGTLVGISAPLEDASNAFTIHTPSQDVPKILQLLGEYGKSKVVKEYSINTRSGIISSLKSVDIVPYVTTETIVTNGVIQTNREAKSTESGIVLNIKPTLDKGFVNLNIDATVSQYLGDKDVGDGYVLPMQRDNKIQTHITTRLGDTAILTGLKLKQNDLNYKGLPNMHNNVGGILTGTNDDEVQGKEYLVFITPKAPRR